MPLSNAPHRSAEEFEGRCVPVDLGARAYDVLVGSGLLARAATLIDRVLGAPRCAIVTDENLASRHLPALEAALEASGRHAGTIVLPPGEATKSFRELAPLCERLLAAVSQRYIASGARPGLRKATARLEVSHRRSA